jgi:hypothetical protein
MSRETQFAVRRELTMTYPEDIEAPEADAAEQATPADPRDEPDDEPPALGDEVPEGDAAEQGRTVLLDDDYS